jgi:hypothetical protein
MSLQRCDVPTDGRREIALADGNRVDRTRTHGWPTATKTTPIFEIARCGSGSDTHLRSHHQFSNQQSEISNQQSAIAI